MPDLGGGHLEYLQLLNSCPLQLLEMVGQEGVSLTTVLTIHHQWCCWGWLNLKGIGPTPPSAWATLRKCGVAKAGGAGAG